MISSPSRATALATLLAALLGGCSGRASSKAPGAIDADALPKLTLTEVQRFGSEQSPDTGFSLIAGAAVDRDGRIYALDAQDLRIRVFDSAGALVRTIGRRGEGPGEFHWAPRFGVAGDTLWTFELFGGRLTLFDLKGDVLRTANVTPVLSPIPGSSYQGMQVPALLWRDGDFVGDMQGWSMRGGKAQPAGADSLTPRLVFDGAGRIVDTLEWFRPDAPPTSSEFVEVGGRRYGVPEPMSDRPLTLLTPDGEILVDRGLAADAHAGVFSVTRRTYSEDTVYHETFSYRPRPYPDEFLDTLAREYAVGAFSPGSGPPKPSPPAERAIRDKIHFPPFQPPVEGRLAGVDGGVWLEREHRGSHTYEWIVIAPDGTPRGRVEIPRGERPLWTRGHELLTSVPDSLGVPWLVRYRLGPR